MRAHMWEHQGVEHDRLESFAGCVCVLEHAHDGHSVCLCLHNTPALVTQGGRLAKTMGADLEPSQESHWWTRHSKVQRTRGRPCHALQSWGCAVEHSDGSNQELLSGRGLVGSLEVMGFQSPKFRCATGKMRHWAGSDASPSMQLRTLQTCPQTPI